MGCDYYATEKGQFKLEVIDYDTGVVLGTIHLAINPKQKLLLYVDEGIER